MTRDDYDNLDPIHRALFDGARSIIFKWRMCLGRVPETSLLTFGGKGCVEISTPPPNSYPKENEQDEHQRLALFFGLCLF